MPSIFPTPCECTDAGWCTRHRCDKTRLWFELCRRRIEWFRLWEQHEGPIPQQSAPAFPPRNPCRHIGLETRRQECPTCLGHVQLKVFACRIHGECALSTHVADVACCQTCPDYDEPGPQPSIERRMASRSPMTSRSNEPP